MGQQRVATKGSVIIFNREFGKSWTTSVEGKLQLRYKESDDSFEAYDSPSIGHLDVGGADGSNRRENEQLAFKDVQFVDFNGSSEGSTKSNGQSRQLSVDARKLIRSHAMKKVHQRRRAQKVSAEQSSMTAKGFRAFVEPGEVSYEQVAKSEAPASPTSPPRSLPFHGGFPIDLNCRCRELLTYYMEYHLQQVFSPVPQATRETARKTWFALAICDELLFRTLLLVASASWKSTGNICPLQETDLLARPVYGLLRQRLSDVTFSESTLGAVSCLVAAERLLGNHERQAAHQAGLVEMLRLKGGLAACSDALRHKLLRSDALLMRRWVDTSASPHRWTSLLQKTET